MAAFKPVDRNQPANDKTAALNRKARFNYTVLEVIEAGLALTGTEIKSIREGRVSIREAYVRPREGELWLVDAHIAHYPPAGPANHEPTRDRKLLLHRKEIRQLTSSVNTAAATIIPLRLYMSHGIAKIEIALAKGKRRYDKRVAIAKREADRQIRRAVGHRVKI